MNLLTLPNGIYFFISTWIQVSLAAFFVMLALMTVVLWLKRRVRATLVSSTIVLMLGLATAVVTARAPPRAWTTLLSAYESPTTGSLSEVKLTDLQRIWVGTRGHLSLIGWWRISHKWGVCHEMWAQDDCSRASGHRDAQGIAREMLQEATGRKPVRNFVARDARKARKNQRW